MTSGSQRWTTQPSPWKRTKQNPVQLCNSVHECLWKICIPHSELSSYYGITKQTTYPTCMNARFATAYFAIWQRQWQWRKSEKFVSTLLQQNTTPNKTTKTTAESPVAAWWNELMSFARQWHSYDGARTFQKLIKYMNWLIRLQTNNDRHNSHRQRITSQAVIVMQLSCGCRRFVVILCVCKSHSLVIGSFNWTWTTFYEGKHSAI